MTMRCLLAMLMLSGTAAIRNDHEVTHAMSTAVEHDEISELKHTVSQADVAGVLGLSANGTVSYGLSPRDCPNGELQKSEEGLVTVDKMKTALGAKTSDIVKFWWIYQSGTKDGQKSGQVDHFKDFGGFKYEWDGHVKCLGFAPVGKNFILEPSAYTPTVTKWYPVTIQSPNKHYAWIPPTGEKNKCENGCFVYKSATGTETTMAVVTASTE